MMSPGTNMIDTIGQQYTGVRPETRSASIPDVGFQDVRESFPAVETATETDTETTVKPAPATEDQAGLLRRMAARLGADPADPQIGTAEGLARVGAERLISSAFLEPIIRDAREKSAPTGLFAPGTGEKRFGHLFDRAIADSIAASTEFTGVASMERRLLERIEKTLGTTAAPPNQVASETRS